MKEWWSGLQTSERRILIIGGVFLLLVLPYFGVWLPLQDSVSTLQKEVQEQQAVKRWMQQAAAEVKQLKASGGGSAVHPRDGRSLLAVVDQTAKRTGLGPGLRRLEPEGQAAVRVWLEQVSFDAMVGWLAGLEQQNGLVVDTITIDRKDIPGRVDARMTLEAPGP
jgi:general secretion pathway protein M